MSGYGHSSRNQAPCQNCEDRFVGCHGQCEKYKAFKENLIDKSTKIKYHLHPQGSRYFRERTQISLSAKKSKKRYR